MRVIFPLILILIFSSIFALLVMSTITGNLVNTPNCQGRHTYAFYRTLAERQGVEQMYKQAGFAVVSDEPAPESFQKSGYRGFLCMRRMNNQELMQETMRERSRVVTIGSSKSLSD